MIPDLNACGFGHLLTNAFSFSVCMDDTVSLM